MPRVPFSVDAQPLEQEGDTVLGFVVNELWHRGQTMGRKGGAVGCLGACLVWMFGGFWHEDLLGGGYADTLGEGKNASVLPRCSTWVVL